MRPFTPQDLYGLRTVSDPRVSPDGGKVAFTVTELDDESNEYRSAVWVAPAKPDGPQTAGGRQFTAGREKDSRPRWSPDGNLIAFVSHREEKGSQLYVIPVGGGEPRQIAESPEEIEELAWSPDSSGIAFLSRDRDEEQYGPEKDKDRPPRRITRLMHRLDGAGWTFDRPRRLFVVPANGSEKPVPLTSGEFQDSGLSWSPDGSKIVFASARHDTWDIDFLTDLFLVPSDGAGDPERLTQTDGGYSLPSFSPSGDQIAFCFAPDRLNWPRHTRIGVMEANGTGTRLLTDELDRNCAPFMTAREPVWSGGDVYFGVEDRGNVHLYRAPADGSGKPELVLGDDRWITGFDLVASTIAFVDTSPARQTELKILGTAGSPQGERSVYAPAKLDAQIQAPTRFAAVSADGSEVEAWVVKPAGYREGVSYPTLLSIHGGPFTQYGNRLFDEFQVYAGAGYAVVYSNPRGSSGYSEAWGRAIRGRKASEPGSGWGGVDFEDLMAVMDSAIEKFDFIDASRLGVLGGSYGGFMTSWIVGHTDRFRAACSERALNSHLTFAFTSDIGPVFQGYFGSTYLEDPEDHAAMSPITFIDQINTPLLILHSENDLRCPISQAEELFYALKLAGKQVEFVRFPGEGHELSRSGSPKHRIQRFEIILDFFGRFLEPLKPR